MFRLESFQISKLFSRKRLTSAETRHLADELKTCCGLFLDPTIRSPNIQGDKAQKILRTLVRRSRRDILQHIPERDAILECSLILVQNYVAHLQLRRQARRPAFAQAKPLFQAVIDMLIPEQQNEVIDIILRFLQQENLWKVEFICVEILQFVLECQSPAALLLAKLIDHVEQCLARSNIDQVRHVLAVLQNIIEPPHWQGTDYSELAKLLRFYHTSVFIGTTRNQIYELRRGFEKCLKKLILLLSELDRSAFFVMMLPLLLDTELSSGARIEFASIVEYAAAQINLGSNHLAVNGSFIVEYLLQHLAADDTIRCVQSCKVLTKLLESGNHNSTQFQSPKIFFIDTYYPIRLGRDFAALEKLLFELRPQMQHALLQAMLQHSAPKMNLDVFYQLICTVLVEAPGGFTAAAVCCLLLQLQKMFSYEATKVGESSGESSEAQAQHLDWVQHRRRIHGTVMAAMTLMSWIHRTGTLNEHVNGILNARFEHAPFLNPPLREVYRCAPHHIDWHEDRLFFNVLSIRYGLWKCFRLSEERIPKPVRMRSTGSTDDPRSGRLTYTLKRFVGA
ncbi:uncharacterized protein LOC118461816 [Anopheles albimanus]|nr:uncharacterized protein LOC118461816 [Anopheles albimanus]